MGANPDLLRLAHSLDWSGSFWQVGEGQYLETDSSQLYALPPLGCPSCGCYRLGYVILKRMARYKAPPLI